MKTYQKILIFLFVQLFGFQQYSIAQDALTIVTSSGNESVAQDPLTSVKPARKKFKAQDTLDIVKPDRKKFKTQDTLIIAEPARKKFMPEPLKATMMAVALPGLGQIYNRKYWKIPVVYAGFGGLIYSIGFNSKQYTTYMRAYQDFTDAIKETDSYVELIPAPQQSYDPVIYPSEHNPATASNYRDQMLRMVDSYKRYRDLSYIGLAAWYLVSVLDANVDASLFNFDMSDNLDLTMAPVQLSMPGGYIGAGLNVSLKINF